MQKTFNQQIADSVNAAVKIRLLCLLLPPLLLAAPLASAQANTNIFHVEVVGNQSAYAMTFVGTVFETPETKESRGISNKVTNLLLAKNYDGLDDFFDKLRSSKAIWATGQWKLYNAYCGLCLAEAASDAAWSARLAALQSWIAEKPESISARVALAEFLTDYAWKARGSGWADSVTEEGWRQFRQRLDQCTDVLNDAGKLKAKCPVYWSVKMTVALGLQTEKSDFKTIFDEAIQFAPRYQAYFSSRAYYLLPRWYGDEGEWESDLARSADRIGGKDGDAVYARVVWCMQNCIGTTNFFTENNLSWARVDRGFDIIEKEFPDSLAAKSEHAHLAVLAGDRPKARQYFDQTEGKVDLSVWRSEGQYVRNAGWAYAQ
jgi:hypothetical protein